MRIFFLSLILILTVGPAVKAASQGLGIDGHIAAGLGGKWIDSDDWGDAGDQLAYHLTFDFRKPTWPLYLVLEYIGSAGKHETPGPDIHSAVIELAIGVRKYWTPNKTYSLYVGAGPTVLIGAIEESERTGIFNTSEPDREDSGAGIGAWAGGGLLIHVTEKLFFGGNARYSIGEVEIFNTDRDAGGFLLTAVGGVRF